MEYIALDVHKRYTWARVENAHGDRVTEQRVLHQRGARVFEERTNSLAQTKRQPKLSGRGGQSTRNVWNIVIFGRRRMCSRIRDQRLITLITT